MIQTTASFIEGLRHDIGQWKSQLALMDVGAESKKEYLQTSELRAWIEAGERIIAQYERRYA
jgi:hypothetical protein